MNDKVSFHYFPIGFIRTEYNDRADAPRQPGVDANRKANRIELLPQMNFEQALLDLSGFERIWLIFAFDRNPNWKAKVLPPRSGGKKRGVFATRSPHRPNPIGISAVRLLSIQGRTMFVGECDLLDGTPILDIKPYIPYADAFPDSRIGWLEEAAERAQPRFTLVWSEEADAQVQWILHRENINVRERAESVLSVEPFPHPYRRIKKRDEHSYELAMKAWRIIFRVENSNVLIDSVESGFLPSALLEQDPKTSLHSEFIALFSHKKLG